MIRPEAFVMCSATFGHDQPKSSVCADGVPTIRAVAPYTSMPTTIAVRALGIRQEIDGCPEARPAPSLDAAESAFGGFKCAA
jgi:hypothetical protein